MINRLRLRHFKGFKDFTVTFGEDALLVGPNNAGKSTIIGALRLCGAATRVAMRVKPSASYEDSGRWVRGYPLSSAMSGSGFVSENIRYEFRERESRLDLRFGSGAELHLVWPLEAEPYFWVEYPHGLCVTTAAKAREVLHHLGLVPTLTPVEHTEKILSPDHVKSNWETRLASRHFRNQLNLVKEMDGESAEELFNFLLAYTPEITKLDIVHSFRGEGGPFLDFYLVDEGSRIEKEVFWAGDGIQIWLQVLFHLWRHRASETVVLDEPDVFLHPDLQRRLIHLLEQLGHQSIMATHASEVASEAQQGSVIWIDRLRKKAARVADDEGLGDLTRVLGSGFNLAVARALRSRIALFVEGEDMKVLRALAKTLGARAVAAERGLSVVPIGGFTHWPSVEAFAWLKSELLGTAVDVVLLLDRDYRSDEASKEFEAEMRSKGVDTHVWRRKELESYLLVPAAISRISELPLSETTVLLQSVCDSMKTSVQSQFVTDAIKTKDKKVDLSTATDAALRDFEATWSIPDERLRRVPPKDVISGSPD